MQRVHKQGSGLGEQHQRKSCVQCTEAWWADGPVAGMKAAKSLTPR